MAGDVFVFASGESRIVMAARIDRVYAIHGPWAEVVKDRRRGARRVVWMDEPKVCSEMPPKLSALDVQEFGAPMALIRQGETVWSAEHDETWAHA